MNRSLHPQCWGVMSGRSRRSVQGQHDHVVRELWRRRSRHVHEEYAMASSPILSDRRGCLVARLFRRTRWAVLDGLCWVITFTAATWLRCDFDLGRAALVGLLAIAGLATCVWWTAGAMTRLYAGRYMVGSLDEATHLTGLTIVVTALVSSVDILAGVPLVPRSVPLTAPLFALLIILGTRTAARSGPDRRDRYCDSAVFRTNARAADERADGRTLDADRVCTRYCLRRPARRRHRTPRLTLRRGCGARHR
jgi:hypothetical protein